MSHRNNTRASALSSSEQALRDSIREMQQELDKLSPTSKRQSATRKNYEKMIRSSQQLLDEHEKEEAARSSAPRPFGRDFAKLLGMAVLASIAAGVIAWLTPN